MNSKKKPAFGKTLTIGVLTRFVVTCVLFTLASIVMLFFGMFGTSVSSLVAVLTYTGQKSAWLSAHRTLVLLVLTAAAFAGSLFGFGDLIGTVYPVYGYLGMAAMLLVTEHAIHARRAAAGD